MHYSTSKKSRSRRKASRRGGIKFRWVLAVIVLFIGFVFFSGPKSLFKVYSLVQEKNGLVKSVQQLKQKNTDLDTEIERLKTDTTYIEKIAREKFGLKRDDEEVVIINPR